MRNAYNRRGAMVHDRRTAMAKGQKRSNREVKKPKADKKKAPASTGSVPDALAKTKPGAAAAGKK
jgi:hypothetical protein